MSLVIIGCGLGPGDLTERMRRRIEQAEILAGGRRLLDWFAAVGVEKIELGATARQVAAQLLRWAATAKVVVLASGDPLFFGIAGTFCSLLEGSGTPIAIEIWPNLSSVQAACARLGREWGGLEFFNLHGRKGDVPWRSILRAPHGAMLLAGSGESAAQKLAAKLISAFPPAAGRRATVLSDLGRPEREAIFTATLAEIAEAMFPSLSLLYIEAPTTAAAVPSLALGLPAEDFVHQAGLITKPEVRALVLAKLGLVPGVFWDLGAGSGSVAVEAALIQPGLRVCAVERDEARCCLIRENTAKLGCVSAVDVYQREIWAVLDELPDPDRVFVGGSGKDVGKIVAAAFARLHPGGRLVAAAVTLESRALLSRVDLGADREMIEVNVSRSRPLGEFRLLKSENPIALFVFNKPDNGEYNDGKSSE